MAMDANRTPHTRKKLRCPIFGAPKELTVDDVMLPTYYDVMKYYIWTKYHLKPTACNKDPTVTEISEQIAATIEHLWHKASVPIVSHTRVLLLNRTYHDKYMKQIKPFKGRQGEDNYQRKLQKFRDDSKLKLFDIAACKCKESLCKCNKIKRVPVEEHTFLLDQRTTRKMVIGGIDKTITEHIHKRMIRQSTEAAKRAKEATRIAESDNAEIGQDRQNTNSSFDEQSSAESSGEEVVPVPTTPSTSTVNSKVTPNRKRYELSALARTCDRYAVSDRAAAAIASAVLEDVGVITIEDKTSVIDRSKLRRERLKKRKKLQHEQTLDNLRGLYFDGRKDKTLEQFKQGTKYHRKTIVEEHLSLVQEPGSKYIGHVTTKSGTALCIENSISKYLDENNIATSELTAVGCDGTNEIQGKKAE